MSEAIKLPVQAVEVEADEDAFEAMLNDSHGTVTICGMEFDQGHALRVLDPIAFRCALADEPMTYECPTCSTEYDDDGEAEECCERWSCSNCGKIHEEEEDAEECCPEED